MSPDLQRLVDAADTAALLRAVDGLCAGREWAALAELARRCTDAVELGKQLWPITMHIEYRLAWEGPPVHAASVLQPGAARFALGPLTEVAASTHDWASLAPHLDHPVTAATVAAERVLRGEDLTAVAAAVRTAELPLRLQSWEPSYALPTYRDRSAVFPSPDVAPGGSPRPAAGGGVRLGDDPAVRGLVDVVEAWSTQSTGAVAAVAVEGGAAQAVGVLSPGGQLQPVTSSGALAQLQWAGASGGAHGRRRGGAAGRFSAWWAVAALTGVDWPDEPGRSFAHELGEAVAELGWYRWHDDRPQTGWVLRLAAEDPADGLAWAVDASDGSDAE